MKATYDLIRSIPSESLTPYWGALSSFFVPPEEELQGWNVVTFSEDGQFVEEIATFTEEDGVDVFNGIQIINGVSGFGNNTILSGGTDQEEGEVKTKIYVIDYENSEYLIRTIDSSFPGATASEDIRVMSNPIFFNGNIYWGEVEVIHTGDPVVIATVTAYFYFSAPAFINSPTLITQETLAPEDVSVSPIEFNGETPEFSMSSDGDLYLRYQFDPGLTWFWRVSSGSVVTSKSLPYDSGFGVNYAETIYGLPLSGQSLPVRIRDGFVRTINEDLNETSLWEAEDVPTFPEEPGSEFSRMVLFGDQMLVSLSQFNGELNQREIRYAFGDSNLDGTGLIESELEQLDYLFKWSE